MYIKLNTPFFLFYLSSWKYVLKCRSTTVHLEKDGVVLLIFNKTSYNRWKARLRLFLEYKDCVDVLVAATDDKADQLEKKADCRVRNYIVSSLSCSI